MSDVEIWLMVRQGRKEHNAILWDELHVPGLQHCQPIMNIIGVLISRKRFANETRQERGHEEIPTLKVSKALEVTGCSSVERRYLKSADARLRVTIKNSTLKQTLTHSIVNIG
jgi:hypothetical protein